MQDPVSLGKDSERLSGRTLNQTPITFSVNTRTHILGALLVCAGGGSLVLGHAACVQGWRGRREGVSTCSVHQHGTFRTRSFWSEGSILARKGNTALYSNSAPSTNTRGSWEAGGGLLSTSHAERARGEGGEVVAESSIWGQGRPLAVFTAVTPLGHCVLQAVVFSPSPGG